MSSTRQVTPSSAKAAIRTAFHVQRPLFLWGAPGIGKSDIVHQVAKEYSAPVIDIRLSLWEPTDIKGIPYFDSSSGTMVWGSPAELPSKEFASQHKNIVLFLDEMNSAAPSVQAAAYQLILNRRVGQYRLPDNVLIVAAGNRETDRGVTYRMPAPLSNRFIHIEIREDFDDWFEWAAANNIHTDVVGYLSFAKQDLYDFNPKSDSRAFATPRSWSFVSELLKDENTSESTLLDLISGTVGDGLAIKFMAHRKLVEKLPQPKDIIAGKITQVEDIEISVMYSLAVSLVRELEYAHSNRDKKFKEYQSNFLTFIMNNFEVELVVVAARLATIRGMIDVETKGYENFVAKYRKYINPN